MGSVLKQVAKVINKINLSMLENKANKMFPDHFKPDNKLIREW